MSVLEEKFPETVYCLFTRGRETERIQVILGNSLLNIPGKVLGRITTERVLTVS